ncbi:adenine glycosylase [Tractidigestivibacter scatoligenes]|jgi:A/G-specific adenine glycosylase|uniref:adenine glycosylase n=1 Tax=Tractidigestivibacter scatoligenes TaxID=1299998 RepID=UPI002F35843B
MPSVTDSGSLPTAEELASFRAAVLARGRELYRDLPWRRTRDPYAIWISEVMLQQTQVSRVDGRWQHWLGLFPTVDALASADSADVLDEWQGLGYNRRALSLWRAAQEISATGGQMPSDEAALKALPGVGPATAAGIRAFAFDMPGVYLETNVRTVLLHELFPHEEGVSDTQLVPIVRATCPPDASDPTDDPRTWYYALLDYGAHLKATVPNPSRRSRSHVRQSRFEGSHRQKRAEVLRILLAHRADPRGGVDLDTLCVELSREERAAGRRGVDASDAQTLLTELSKEGFCHNNGNIWCT